MVSIPSTNNYNFIQVFLDKKFLLRPIRRSLSDTCIISISTSNNILLLFLISTTSILISVFSFFQFYLS